MTQQNFEYMIQINGCWEYPLSTLMTVDVDPSFYVTINITPRVGMATSDVSSWYCNIGIPLEFCPIQDQVFPCFYVIGDTQYQGDITISTLGDITYNCNAANKIGNMCLLTTLGLSYQAINPLLSKQDQTYSSTKILNDSIEVQKKGILIDKVWYYPASK